ncbi:UNVERIFIED_ORG: ribosomal-protein-alanine N-acetyltransferase [Arthrobacter sp. UYCu721]
MRYMPSPPIKRIAEFVEWGPNTTADTQNFLETCVSAQIDPERANFTLAITVPHRDPIGSVGLSLRGGKGEIGYVIAADCWGRGYATEAAQSLLRFGLEELGLSEITATCRPENTASARVLEKIGMCRSGLRKADKLIRGQWRDSLVFAVLGKG